MMKKSTRFLISIAFFLCCAWTAPSLELTFRLTPGIGIPLNKNYETGFGATASV